MPRTCPLVLLLTLASAYVPTPASAQGVTIYRCTGKGGALTLRDSPCAAGQEQDVLNMQRPKDPPPGRDAPRATQARPRAAAPVREVQVIYRTAPRPMYECVDDEGRRYTSDNDFGNRRWVPLWTLGFPVWQHRGAGVGYPSRPLGIPGGHVVGSAGPHYAGVIPGGGTWISDQCSPLPQEEVCDRLSDRRYEIIRRYNSAGTSERRQLDLEQRGIDARLSNDCGIN